MVGKILTFFPMIGRIYRAFSNEWKKFSAQGERKGSARGNTKNTKGMTQRTQRREAEGHCVLCVRFVFFVLKNGAPAPAARLKSGKVEKLKDGMP